jgi:hypothetical protein
LVPYFLAVVLFAAPRPALAADDFGRIVHHIETQYHVHRQHRLAMGFAGLVSSSTIYGSAHWSLP